MEDTGGTAYSGVSTGRRGQLLANQVSHQGSLDAQRQAASPGPSCCAGRLQVLVFQGLPRLATSGSRAEGGLDS